MAKAKKVENNRIDTSVLISSIVGEGAHFKGEFIHCGALRIDGNFTGVVETEGKVLVGEKGCANADISAKNIIIGGKVNGNIRAMEVVTILTTGSVKGNLVAPKVIMEEGTIFCGNIIINQNQPSEGEIKEVLKSNPELPAGLIFSFDSNTYQEKITKNTKGSLSESENIMGSQNFFENDDEHKEEYSTQITKKNKSKIRTLKVPKI